MSRYFEWADEIKHLSEEQVEELYQRYLNGEKNCGTGSRIQHFGECPQSVEGIATHHQQGPGMPLLRPSHVGASACQGYSCLNP